MKRSALSNLSMVAGNEKRYPTVILDGRVTDWIGYGWLDMREATVDDHLKYPVVVD